VNANPHIGFAMELLYADVLARYHKQQGYTVAFSTGTDEHGQKVADTAAKLGRTPQEHTDELSQAFRDISGPLSIESTDFIRTTEERHTRAAQLFWEKAVAAGDITKGSYTGLYCVGCESFKTEKELLEGKCPIHLTAPQEVREENYFFHLSKYGERLLAYYHDHPDFVIPEYRLHEMEEIIRSGLEDISISREKAKLSWGVPVPGDDSQVMYVWFEALLNYLTVCGYGENGHDAMIGWPADYIIVGKDINRFHSIIFGAMLMSAGIPLPKHIGVHGFITVDGQKMSKSLGNVINPLDIVKQYGTEPTRYYLLREIPFTSDGDFSHARFTERYNADLANALGNLCSRVTNMVEKYFDGVLEPKPATEGYGTDERAAYENAMEQLHFSRALEATWKLVYEANEYIEQHKPWALAKTDMDALKAVLQHLLYTLDVVSELLSPFMPGTAQKITHSINAERITKSEPLFPKLTDTK
jgi:methionyl-tRNA synthetase